MFKPMLLNNNPYKGLHHLFQLDCVLIKDFSFIKKFDNEKLIKLILILFYSFKSYDLVYYLISILDKNNNTNFLNEYKKILSKVKFEKIY